METGVVFELDDDNPSKSLPAHNLEPVFLLVTASINSLEMSFFLL